MVEMGTHEKIKPLPFRQAGCRGDIIKILISSVLRTLVEDG